MQAVPRTVARAAARAGHVQARRSFARAFATTRCGMAEGSGGGGGGFMKSLLHGSEEARAQDELVQASHSEQVARGKYVHHIIKHHVKPGQNEEYKAAIANYYSVMANMNIGVRHVGSWEITIGEMDTFLHILEFPNGYAGFDTIKPAMNKTDAHHEFLTKCLPLVDKRETSIGQEFAFWPTAQPQERGGIYELRQYQLLPGKLLEWETEWRRGLEARKHHHQPIAAYFSQLGTLHQVMHIWHYPDLQTRDESRKKAWSIQGWAQTVSRTVKLTDRMSSSIMEPLPNSPIR